MSNRFHPYVTVAAIIECRDRFLLVSEIDDRPYEVYGQPAGHIEEKEDLIDAVKREILEETGLNLEPQGISGIYSYVKENETIMRFCFYIKDDFLPDELNPKDPDGEILNAKWYTKDEIFALKDKYRTRLVKHCFNDYFNGHRYPLEMLTTINP